MLHACPSALCLRDRGQDGADPANGRVLALYSRRSEFVIWCLLRRPWRLHKDKLGPPFGIQPAVQVARRLPQQAQGLLMGDPLHAAGGVFVLAREGSGALPEFASRVVAARPAHLTGPVEQRPANTRRGRDARRRARWWGD